MKVLHLISDTDRRGGQVFASDLHRAMGNTLDSSEVVALRPGNVGGLDVETLGTGRFSPTSIRRLRTAMAAVDITIAHGSSTVLACATHGGGRKRPFVVRQISETGYWLHSPARRLRVRSYLARARLVVALAQSAADDLARIVGLPQTKIRIVPNGVPEGPFRPCTQKERTSARRELGIDPDRATMVYVGALVHEKGVDRVIAALDAAPAMQLAIAGDGPLRARLMAQARAIDAPVAFVGSLAEPLTAYHASDVLALASRGGDSMPAVIIEAGMCGVPTIATDVGAIGDLVINDRTGWLVGREDDDGIKAALDASGDAELRRSLGEGARQHMLANFEIDVVAAGWLEVLREAVAT